MPKFKYDILSNFQTMCLGGMKVLIEFLDDYLTPFFPAELEFIGEARGVGLMGALEMVQNKETKQSFDGSISIGERVANQCIENGLICRPLGPSIVLCPPFITSDDEMDIIFETLEKTLKTVFADVKSLI